MPEEEKELVVEKESKTGEKVEEKLKKKQLIEPEVTITTPPFPTRLQSTKKEREDNEIMEMFRQVTINIPLLDAIAQVPRYAKFLKELCTSKKKLTGTETVRVGENVSAVLQKRLPQKCVDPGVFTVPCKLGSFYAPRAMLDNGASINVLPYSIFKTLNVGDLKRTGVAIQLADKSIVHPKGVLEDVLVQVKELVFPADFYVLDMGDDDNPNSSSILLGRPFLKTARTKIDCYDGTLSMEFDGEVINFNISEGMTHPSNVLSVNFLGTIEPHIDNCTVITNHDLQVLDIDRDLAKGTPESRTVKEKVKEVMDKDVCAISVSKLVTVEEKQPFEEAVCESMASKMMVDEKVKKKRKRRKWKWLKVSFPCALKA